MIKNRRSNKKHNRSRKTESKLLCKCCKSDKLIRIGSFTEDNIYYIEYVCNNCNCNITVVSN